MSHISYLRIGIIFHRIYTGSKILVALYVFIEEAKAM